MSLADALEISRESLNISKQSLSDFQALFNEINRIKSLYRQIGGIEYIPPMPLSAPLVSAPAPPNSGLKDALKQGVPVTQPFLTPQMLKQIRMGRKQLKHVSVNDKKHDPKPNLLQKILDNRQFIDDDE